jgi:hypothetical protein
MTRIFSSKTIGALFAAALLAQSAGSASAFTLSAPSIAQAFSTDKSIKYGGVVIGIRGIAIAG